MDAVSGHETPPLEIQDDAEMCSPRFYRLHAMRDPAPSPKRSPRFTSMRPRCGCPTYGVRASAGRRARMEDAVSIVENLLEVSRPGGFWKSDRRKFDVVDTVSSNGSTAAVRRMPKEAIVTEVCHFFGVYDGHNGPYAAHHCRGRLHENLQAAYLELCAGGDSDSESVGVAVDLGVTHLESNARDACSSCSSSSLSEPSLNGPVMKNRNTLTVTEEDVFAETFRRTDRQFSEYRCAERVGTTAVIALVGSHHLSVASCGNSICPFAGSDDSGSSV